jgi:hypothetical protein
MPLQSRDHEYVFAQEMAGLQKTRRREPAG